MNKVVRILAFALMIGGALTTASCGDKGSDPQAQPQTAAISGQISPAGSVTTVTATDASGKTTTATPGSTGAYSFPGLAPGAYTLTFAPAAGYTAPASLPVTLAAAGTTAPAVTVAVAPASASFSANGVPVTPAYIFSQVFFGDRTLTFSVSPGGAPGPTVSIDLDGVTPAVGTYSLTGSLTDYEATYNDANYQSYFTLGNNNGATRSGTLVITNVNASLRRFSGTFEFVGFGTNNAGVYVSARITNGVFTNLSY
ncbi:hypothetical protein [Hymenobacter ruricola]|uniref:Carboxypeptidase regulatory-like domain-containing protein n=1 Tax=Hymenobacter ruricola TaxID=2791023 RepID=A0ABS0I3X7_9BACT|nr:hypothetical protein [Hymenobacter ruricola]MBF9221651.1 hypothetical protein [Hymenobacter ruricola]